MQRYLDGRDWIALAGKAASLKARAVMPLLLAPCLPAIVACSTADMRADGGPQITPAVVARTGPPPLLMRPLSKSAAEALNRRLPFSAEPVIAPAPFHFADRADARDRALECLTSAIYYEASSESDEGERAVAQVVLNRVRHPAFPASVCGVVYQGATLPTGCQFSFTCDGSLQRLPTHREWDRAKAIAGAALAGAIYAPVGLATHYHADYVVPYWAPSLAKAAQVGAHIFYRWGGDWGRPPSFSQRYAADESDPRALRSAALVSHGLWPTLTAPAEPRLTLAMDAEVELNGIVNLLASMPGAGEGSYERQVRAYFKVETARPLLDSLLGKPATAEPAPPDAGLPLVAAAAAELDTPVVVAIAAAPPSQAQLLAAFARETKFAEFLRAHRAVYKASVGQAELLAEQASVEWETYSGAPVARGKAVLSLTQAMGDISCAALPMDKPSRPILDWPVGPRGFAPAEIFISSGLADGSLGSATGINPRKAKQLREAIAPIRDQLVAAVFARIVALSQGEGAGRSMVERERADGHALVPLLAARLRLFEGHRSEYPTLNHFLPTLVAGLGHASQFEGIGAKSADGSVKRCGAIIAAA